MIPFEKFTTKAQQALLKAQEILRELGQQQLDTEHLLYGIAFVEESLLPEILRYMNIDDKLALERIHRAVTRPTSIRIIRGGGLGQIYITPEANRALELSLEIAESMGDEYVGTEHILLALLRLEGTNAYQILTALGVDTEGVLKALKEVRGTQRIDSPEAESRYQLLKKYTVDLTEQARQGKLDPIIGREAEIERTIEILCRRRKNNPVLVGDAGVGKTAIVEGIAQRIVNGEVPEVLLDKRILSLDMAGLVAGTKFRGEFEERLKGVIDEIIASQGQIILFIDELHTVVGAGGAEGAIDASNILKPALARGELHAIGATTVAEYRKYIEKDAALARRFQPVFIEEPTPEQTLEILRGLRPKYEEHHQVRITDQALEAAVRLSERYITDRFLPDKAIDLIDEAAARVRLQNLSQSDRARQLRAQISRLRDESRKAAEQEDYERAAKLKSQYLRLEEELKQIEAEDGKVRGERVVDAEAVAEVVSRWSGVPVERLTETEKERFLRMEEELHRKIIDQEEAVHKVAETLRRAKAGLQDERRPLGSFLFLGPTGVGKTELVKQLANFLFNDPDAIVRIDMSEYGEKFAASRLIGSPPGYVGYEEGGQLTEAVRRKPYSIVLFDELEKAHPEVLNLLLQILDEGRLTDSKGVTVNFKNTVIVMTSNVGSQLFLKGKGTIGYRSPDEEEIDDIREKIWEELKRRFRPEFLNRIDEVVLFRPLSDEHIRQIANLRLSEVAERMRNNQQIELEWDESLVEKLAQEGYDPAFGARPMNRAIQRLVLNPLAEKVLREEIRSGQRIRLSWDGERDELAVEVTGEFEPAQAEAGPEEDKKEQTRTQRRRRKEEKEGKAEA